jgi:sulfonate transport system substrate-binding protein
MAKSGWKDISRRRFLKSAGAVAGGGVMAPAMLRSGLAQSPKFAKTSVFIGTTPQFSNVIVGVEKGFFLKEGLPVELTNFTSGAAAVDAFRTGNGGLVVAGDFPSLRVWNQGGGIGICPQASYDQLSLIVARKTITKPEDFKGKKVGVLLGSTSEYFIRLYLAKAGMQYSDIEAINLRPAEMVTGIVRGDIDAFVIWEPFGWTAEKASPDVRILTTAKGFFHEWEMVTTSKEYAAAHPAELVAFLKGLDAAGKWIPQNLDESAQVIATSLRIDDVTIPRRMIEVIDWNISYTSAFRGDMDRLGTFLNIKPDWGAMFEPKFLAELGPSYVQPV